MTLLRPAALVAALLAAAPVDLASYRQVTSLSIEAEPSSLPEAGADGIAVAFTAPLPLIDAGSNLLLLDDANEPVPFAVARGARAGFTPRNAAIIRTTAKPGGADLEVLLEAVPAARVEALDFSIAEPEFDASVTVTASSRANDPDARVLATDQVLFRRAGGSHTRVELRPEPLERHLVIAVRSLDPDHPVAVTGIRSLHLEEGSARLSTLEVRIDRLTNGPEATWIQASLPARNLEIASLRLEVAGAPGIRRITVSKLSRADGSIGYVTVGEAAAVIRSRSAVVEVPVGDAFPSGELLVTIENGRGAPWKVSSVTAGAVLPTLSFRHRPGVSRYPVYLGGRSAVAPVPVESITGPGAPSLFLEADSIALDPISANPAYLPPPDPVRSAAGLGGTLNTELWPSRKQILFDAPGILQLDLDPEAVAGSRPGGNDLRIVENGTQIPYVAVRNVPPVEQKVAAEETIEGTITRFTFTLPFAPLPVTHITARAGSQVFRRTMIVFEEITGPSGRLERRVLGEEQFTRTGTEHAPEVVIPLREAPRTGRITIEIENGDNAPLRLTDLGYFRPGLRLLFKKETREPCWLHYGNPRANAPVYDLALVSSALMAEKALEARLAPGELVNAPPWWRIDLEGPFGFWLYWIALGLVVVGLVAVIAKLL